MIQEVNHKQVLECIFKKERTVIYFYTPLCGTCKLAKQMLEIAVEAFPDHDKPDVISGNINQMPDTVKRMKVKSVPCLLFLNGGKVEKSLYSFRSVDNVYKQIKIFLE